MDPDRARELLAAERTRIEHSRAERMEETVVSAAHPDEP
jgi:hypothetical protein